MIKKITDKDKEDWENFLNNKKKNLNKNPEKKKEINNPDKDKLNWKNFLNTKKKIPNKKYDQKKNIKNNKIKKIDKVVIKYFLFCFNKKAIVMSSVINSEVIESVYKSPKIEIIKIKKMIMLLILRY